MSTAEPVHETESALRDVRAQPVDVLVSPGSSTFDGALDIVLRELSSKAESLAAFGNTP
ncbi:hypothetical protein [Catenuloplanes japonicus]|uniref:hypothetical protein n=1 Tax=Catenuloplanes japonicus TaxID=33876 RepID=UPI0012F89BBD|nr:hypothetical protein [Catenuloplanes japonicus]